MWLSSYMCLSGARGLKFRLIFPKDNRHRVSYKGAVDDEPYPLKYEKWLASKQPLNVYDRECGL